MSAEYDGPIFDAVYTSGHQGGVTVPSRYLEVTQNRIMDMLPNEPGMAENTPSVVRDRRSGHRFIHTFDDLASIILPREIRQKPFICRAMFDLGKTGVDCYILDYRRVQNLMYPSVDLDFDPTVGIDSIRHFHERQGTQPVHAAIMRYGGEVHYIGERALIKASIEFAESVDNLLENGVNEAGNYACPAYPSEVFDKFHQPDDIQASLDFGRSEDKLN